MSNLLYFTNQTRITILVINNNDTNNGTNASIIRNFTQIIYR